jgi:hypothetical protein
MKSKSAKKLTLAKETLRVLNANDLTLVQSGSATTPTIDPTCLPNSGTSSNSH